MMDFPVAKITYKRFNSIENPVFSILIPTWNNLNCLKFCVESIRRNSHFAHQIILHINQGNDGTIEWAEENEISYSRSAQNAGVCYGFNAPATLAQSDYLVLLNDDMYLCPDWDFYLWQEIEKIGHPYFALSSTMIEHTHTKNNCAMAPHDFGSTPETFNEQALLAVFDKITFHDWNGSKWYPMVIHRKIWELVGGLSIEFSPGMRIDTYPESTVLIPKPQFCIRIPAAVPYPLTTIIGKTVHGISVGIPILFYFPYGLF